MKKLILSSIACATIVAWTFQVTAAPPAAKTFTPKPGNCGEIITPENPGYWSETFSELGEGKPGSIIKAWGAGFEFSAVLQSHEYLDPAIEPYWQDRTVYVDGTLTLKNWKNTPWYNKKFPETAEFTYTGITVVNLTHKPTAAGDPFEFSLVGTLFGDRVIITGGFVGMPNPEIEDGKFIGMNGELTTATVNPFPVNALPKK